MENIPEKFLNKDGTLNTDALLKSYLELEKKIGTMISVPSPDADESARKNLIVPLAFQKMHLNIQRISCLMMMHCVKNFLK